MATLTSDVNVPLALIFKLLNGDVSTSLCAPRAHLEMATSGVTSEYIVWIATAGRGVANRGWVRKHAFTGSYHPALGQNCTSGQVGCVVVVVGAPTRCQNSLWVTI